MMRANWKPILISVLLALLIVGAGWSWFTYMEKYWEARPNISNEAQKNPMLGASRFLMQHRYSVVVEHSLNDALINTPSKGTLLIAENNGIMTPGQSKQLLAWVEQGNTLIAIPKRMPDKLNNSVSAGKPNPQDTTTKAEKSDSAADTEKDSDAEDADDAEDEEKAVAEKKPAQVKELVPLIETDPISTYLGVALGDDTEWNNQSKKVKTVKADGEGDTTVEPDKRADVKENTVFPVSDITFPNAAYALQVWRGGRILQSTTPQSIPFFSDAQGKAIRVYSQGKGHIVVIDNNYFSNDNLPYFDHAELLLALTQLNGLIGGNKNFLIVQHLNMPTWLEMLWSSYRLAIISIACALLLLFWRAIRRFGPLLPEPNNDRRSLIEHIDASGRWLWKVRGGREALLTAVRDSTRQFLQRRAPELQSLPFPEQIERMALHSKIEKAALINAWQEPAAKLPMVFFHQIQTLQQLRKNYER